VIGKFARSRLFLVALASMLAAGLFFAPRTGGCQSAHAANGDLPSDYCYQLSITTTYNGTSTLTNYAVRAGIPAASLIASSQMNDYTWDLQPFVGSWSQQTDVTAQDLTQTTAYWWFQIPTAATGQRIVTTLYFGLPDTARDQGVLFVGADSASAAHHADFNVTDNLTLDVGVEMLSGSAQTATLASHWTGSQGYRMLLVNVAGDLTIRGQVDGSTCDVTWNPTGIWTNTNRLITMAFANPNITISVDGAVQNTCNTGLPSITATSTAFTFGDTLANGVIRDVRVRAGAEDVRAHWGLNPGNMTETVTTNPFQGTISDESGRGHTATYTFNRADLANFTTPTVSSVSLVSAGEVVAVPTPLSNIVGSRNFGIEIATPQPTPSTGMFAQFFGPGAAAFPGPRDLYWTTFFMGAALGLLAIGYLVFRQIAVALLPAGAPLIYGMVNGYVPVWFFFIWGVFTFGAWMATLLGGAGQE
jgi:hypothetical protein